MEHSVLCGSRKYRCKEPFIELVKGSLKTFVNAMTGTEATYYPVASTNLKDFYNLIDVYLDSVFYPLINEHAFHQEGWRYELEKSEDEMIYKGVVFNEMKGYYASPDLHLYDHAQQELMPDTIFAHDSGGNPQNIPDLTYEAFSEFHNKFYHPSNSRITFYGDDDPDERLRLMDSWLSDFERQNVDSKIELQKPFDEPRSFAFSYPVGKDAVDPKCHIVVGWLVNGGLECKTALAYEILSYILIQSPASPLRKRLEDSGLGSQVTGGLQEGAQMQFYAGLKDVAKEDALKVEDLILSALEDLAKNGIDQEMVEAALNTTEFLLRENNTGAFPRGLVLSFRALQFWLHDEGAIAPLSFEGPLEIIKEDAAPGSGYFESLILGGLLDNKHRVTILIEPDSEMSERLDHEEKARIDKERAAMSEQQIEKIIEETHALRKIQETPDTPEQLAVIPTLTLADLDKENKTISVDIKSVGSVPLYHNKLSTSGIVYLDLAFNLSAVPQTLLPYIPLLGAALTQLGTSSLDYVRLLQRIGQKTGGIGASPFFSPIYNSSDTAAWLIVRSKALPSQTDDLLAILQDLLLNVRLDNKDRLRQMVLERKSRYESSMPTSGGSMAAIRLGAHFSVAGAIGAQTGGVSYYFFLRELLERIDNHWDEVLADLIFLQKLIVNRAQAVINVTLDEDNFSRFEPGLADFASALPERDVDRALWIQPVDLPEREALTIPAQVSAVAKAANLFDLGFKHGGEAAVIAKWLRTTWLWEQVRMKGGAYGANCSFDPRTGVFNFGSSQDPNIIGTLETFDKTAEFLRTAALTDADVTRSIIGAISDIDSYQLPDAKGYSAFVRRLTGYTDELRQQVRDEVLATSTDSFRKFADALEAGAKVGRVVVVGPPTAIANAAKSLPFTITPVL
jgi:Zn-dependent M16 (insulinase) family peptidase